MTEATRRWQQANKARLSRARRDRRRRQAPTRIKGSTLEWERFVRDVFINAPDAQRERMRHRAFDHLPDHIRAKCWTAVQGE